MFHGLDCNLNNLYLLSDAQSRAVSAENKDGAKGGACRAEGGSLGRGWKCSPAIMIHPGETAVTADIDGSGAIKSMWVGGDIDPHLILRIYWDGSDKPSVECPLNAFFAYKFTSDTNHYTGDFPILNSMPVVVAPCRGMNCFWQMPFRKHCKITLENTDDRIHCHFYMFHYVLTEVPEEIGYFHAQYREQTPVEYKVPYTVIDGIHGKGQYVGYGALCHSERQKFLLGGRRNEVLYGRGYRVSNDKLYRYRGLLGRFVCLCGAWTHAYLLSSLSWNVLRGIFQWNPRTSARQLYGVSLAHYRSHSF